MKPCEQEAWWHGYWGLSGGRQCHFSLTTQKSAPKHPIFPDLTGIWWLGSAIPVSPPARACGGQPAITVVTSISDGILPRPVVTPFSFLTGDSGAAGSGTRGAVRGTPPPRGRSADFGPVVPGQTVILNPCAAGGLLGWKRAVREGGSAEVSENCSTALGTTHSAGKLLKNMYFCSLLTSEAGVSLAGAAGQPGVRPRG